MNTRTLISLLEPTMRAISLFLVPLLGVVLMSGCASSTPQYDARFGDAVRQARHAMTLNPAAAAAVPIRSFDGKPARHAADRYHDSFKAPPPVVNVINIGGAVGSGGGGGGGNR
ncbi:hypothetical protein WG922_07130 [Ramlibacter sp. AN1015]|uniref:hypothetical protein n=1 Tax=Ramlibacter sp. AN1015 TaxID=3133428 RepID=UPI0030C56083